LALGMAEPKGAEAQAAALRAAAAVLLKELADPAYPHREDAFTLAETLGRANWGWAWRVSGALQAGPLRQRQYRGSGLDAWARLPEWEDEAPRGEAGTLAVDS